MKFQVPTIGGLRKVVKPNTGKTTATTITGFEGGTLTVQQLAQALGLLPAPNDGGGNIGDGSQAYLKLGPGLSGGGILVGTVEINLTAPIPGPGFSGIGGGDGSGGEDGERGPPGPKGDKGDQGLRGAPGEPGEDGDSGSPGMPGAQGIQGIQGIAGATGNPGPPGVDGEDGRDGIPGGPGPVGATGANGANGTNGNPGPPGQDGEDGTDGVPGIPGPVGASGVNGANGANGNPGPPGQDGEDGTDGVPGIPGPVGPIGPQGPAGTGSGSTVVIEYKLDDDDATDPFQSYPVWMARFAGTSGQGVQIGLPASGESLVVNNVVNGGAGINVTDGTISLSLWTITGKAQIGTVGLHGFQLLTNSLSRVDVSNTGAVSINSPSSVGTSLTVNQSGIASAVNVKMVGVSTAGVFVQADATGGAQTGEVSVVGNGGASAQRFALQNDGTLNYVWGFNTLSTVFGVNNVTMMKITTAAIQGLGPVAAALVDMTPDTGSVSLAWTGFGTPPGAVTAVWARVGNVVTITIPGSAGTATSNATSFGLGTLPAAIRPTRQQSGVVPAAWATNNGAAVANAAWTLAPSGVFSFYNNSQATTSWTGSGAKGITATLTISYPLN